MPDGLLERWLAEVVATPGLTALATVDDARSVLLDDALRAASLLTAAHSPVADVGSGGGSPGIPLAVARPDLHFVLVESVQRKAEFLARFAHELSNVEVVWGRAEEQPVDGFGAALAKALAKPPVAAELTLPLVRPGGSALLWTGAHADRGHVARVAARLGAELEDDRDGILVLRKLEPSPPGFPRRPGMAKKRPLG